VKTKTVYDKVSVKLVLIISAVGLLVLNGLTYFVFTLIFKIPFDQLFENSWIILVFLPLMMGVILPLIDRTGEMTIECKGDQQVLNKKIEEILIRNAYGKISENNSSSVFEQLSGLRRMYSFHKGLVLISREKDRIKIRGQKNILEQIESMIKTGPELPCQ
jgi:hypothetical protein